MDVARPGPARLAGRSYIAASLTERPIVATVRLAAAGRGIADCLGRSLAPWDRHPRCCIATRPRWSIAGTGRVLTALSETVELTSTGQETQLSLTNRATRLEASQGHQAWYHSKIVRYGFLLLCHSNFVQALPDFVRF